MAFRFMHAMRYVDEVVGVGLAIAAYLNHKDEGVFAEDCLDQIHSAIRDAYGEDGFAKIDEDQVRKGLAQIVHGIKPLF